LKCVTTPLAITFVDGGVSQHFIFIADAMTFKGEGDNELSLWNEEDGFYYDAIQFGPGHSQQMPIRSLVGLIPLYATLTLEPSVINRFPGFKKRMEWFIDNRPEVAHRNMAMANMRSKYHVSRIFCHISFMLSLQYAGKESEDCLL
jgi:hypothetical protein